MTRATLTAIGLAVAFALCTLLAGWWAVPVVALAAGAALASHRRIAALASLAAALGWLALLAWTATQGALLPFATRLASAMSVPQGTPLLLTIAFAAILAWSGAAVGQGARELVSRTV